MVIVSGMACIYYNAVITWVIYYLVNSFRSELPWSRCGHWWNTPQCIDTRMSRPMVNHTHMTPSLYTNMTGLNGTVYETYSLASNTSTALANFSYHRDGKTAAEEFWQ